MALKGKEYYKKICGRKRGQAMAEPAGPLDYGADNAWLCKEEMRFLSTTPW